MLVSQSYELHPLLLKVQGEDSEPFRMIENLFDGFFCASENLNFPSCFHLETKTVERAQDLPAINPEEYPVFLEGTPEFGVTVRRYAKGTEKRVFVLQETAVTSYDLGRGEAQACCLKNKWGLWGFQTLIPLLAELLSAHGMFLLHAGGVLLPGRKEGILFFGSSGAGKTTTTLSLVQQDMPLICDDAGFLSIIEKRGRFWGLPRECKVHNRSLALVPELLKLSRKPIAKSAEWRIPFREFPFANPRQSYPIRAIFLMQERNSAEHRISPLGPVEALQTLLKGNLRVISPIAKGQSGKMFQALGELCKKTPAFSLSVGPSLNTLKNSLLSCL